MLSVVVPMHNEEEALDAFFARLIPAIAPVCGQLGRDYEVVCVNDGSTDQTLNRLVGHHKRNPAIKIVDLSRNFGKDIALSAGLDFAKGAAVVPIDADLQDPPELIPELFAKWLEGYDVVYATRSARGGDSVFKRLTASWFYRLHNGVADVRIPNDTGDFRLMDRRVVEVIQHMPERHRFMKGLFAWVGFRQIGMPYERESRIAGTTKWKYWRLWNFAIDGFTSSSTLPLRIWTYLGGIVALAAIFFGASLILYTLIAGVDVPGYASTMVAVLFIGSLNLIGLGIQGEYIGRIFGETKSRPLYLVQDIFGFDRNEGFQDKWTVTSTPEWRQLKAGTGGL
ncbi:MAG: glycosyltransferase family 2 protein [Kiloniellales bacterium]